MPFADIGRVTQAGIYRAGTFGRRPRVPTDGQALEEAARRAMSRRAFAYVAAPPAREHRGSEPRGLRPVAGRPAPARRHERARLGRRAVRATPPLPYPRRAGRRVVERTRRRRPRDGARRPGAGRHTDPQHPGVGADGAGRRRARGLRPLVPALLEPRRRPRREPGPPGRGLWERGDPRHPRHGIPRLAPPRPRPGAPALRPWRGHRAVHLGPGLPAAGRRAGAGRAGGGRRGRRATAPTHTRRGAHAGLPEPQPPRRHPAQPVRPRAARRGRDLPRRLLQAVAELGGPPAPARADRPAPRAQGHPAPRGREAGRRGGRRRHPRLEPRRTPGRPQRGRARRTPGGRRRGARRGLGDAGALRQRRAVGCGRLRRAGARRGCRGHRSPVRLRAGARRGRGGVRGAAQHPRRARPDDGPHGLPDAG